MLIKIILILKVSCPVNWDAYNKLTESCFYHSTKNDMISILSATHFIKFLYQPAFGKF